MVWTSDSDFDALKLEMPTYMGGRLISDAEAERVYNEMNSVFDAMAQDAQTIKDPHRPRLGGNADVYDKLALSDWIASRSCTQLTKDALEIQFANTSGAPSHRQSYLANLALVAGAAHNGKPDDFLTMSENTRCAQGNAALARSLASDIERHRGQIHLSTPIRKVEVLQNRVRVTPEAGEAIDTDFAILAIRPSVWPSAHSRMRIEPVIPSDYYVTMGMAVKYLSRVPIRFWIAEGRAPSATSDRCGMLWEGTDNQMQTPDQDVELSLFAGGDAANDAVAAFREGGQDGVREFYDKRITELYPTYPEHRRKDTNFVSWCRGR